MNNLSLISFDADQTLFDFERVMFKALATVSEHLHDRYGIRIGPIALKERRDRIAANAKATTTMLELRRRSFHEVLEEHGVTEPSAAKTATRLFEEVRFGTVYLYKDTLPTLSSLAEKFPLALLTNGNSTAAKAQIGEYFSHSILAEDIGFRKPDKRIFNALLIEAGIPAYELMHVGDSLDSDVRGALDIGATAVYLNRNELQNETEVTPHYEITKLTELLPIASKHFGP